MERFTAFLEVTPYSWFTLFSIALGAVVALLTIRAGRRRYPALFRRRRSIAILLLLLLSALSIPLAIFLPGPGRFPDLSTVLLFTLPAVLLWAGVFRFPRIGGSLFLVLLGLLIWSEDVATRGFLFPEVGEPIAFLEVREVNENRLELFVEFPPVAGRRLLRESLDQSFPLSLEGEHLALAGEMVRVHQYLWWRVPAVGVRIGGFAGAPGEPETFAALSRRRETLLSALEALSILKRTPWQTAVSSENLLLTRYELLLRADEPVLERSRAQTE